jgi:acetyl-CoA carboxylase carboxyl transferase subunit beta
MVVHRHDMRATLARLCRVLTKAPAAEAPAPALVPEEVAVSAE